MSAPFFVANPKMISTSCINTSVDTYLDCWAGQLCISLQSVNNISLALWLSVFDYYVRMSAFVCIAQFKAICEKLVFVFYINKIMPRIICVYMLNVFIHWCLFFSIVKRESICKYKIYSLWVSQTFIKFATSASACPSFWPKSRFGGSSAGPYNYTQAPRNKRQSSIIKGHLRIML